MTDQTSPSLTQLGLFTGVPQHENFARIKDLAPTRAMSPSTTPSDVQEGEPIAPPATYHHDGEARATEDFFVETDTAALLVLQDGVIRHERYALTGGRDVQWLSMSVAKSFVSALVGIAIADGHIGGVEEPISDYVPVEPGSAYDGVSIRDVLQMSSGARWNEDYNDPESDIYRLAAVMTGASTLDAFVATMVRESEPGTVCRYNSADTQALGALLVHATQRSLADYMQDKLVEPLGMTAPGYWVLDSAGREMAFAGVNLTARDFAKLGELYRNDGVYNGTQVVPSAWVRASVTPDAPHLMPGRSSPITPCRSATATSGGCPTATAASSAPSASTTSSSTSIPRAAWSSSSSRQTAYTARAATKRPTARSRRSRSSERSPSTARPPPLGAPQTSLAAAPARQRRGFATTRSPLRAANNATRGGAAWILKEADRPRIGAPPCPA